MNVGNCGHSTTAWDTEDRNGLTVRQLGLIKNK